MVGTVGTPRALERALVAVVAGVLVATVALADLTVSGGSAEAAVRLRPTHPRALWVWSRPDPAELVGFARRRGVRDLFVAVPADLGHSDALSWVRAVRDLARPAGISLQALGGDPGWVDHPDVAVAWARDALTTGLFSGVHLDIEPWTTPAWSQDRGAVVHGFLRTLTAVQRAVTAPVEADVAFWLWTVRTHDGTPLDRAVVDRVDAVTVMSYRRSVTGPDGIVAVAARTVAAAQSAGRPVRLAVETNDLGSDPVARKQTFHGGDEASLDTALTAVDTAESGHPGYAGVAIEDYDGYRALG